MGALGWAYAPPSFGLDLLSLPEGRRQTKQPRRNTKSSVREGPERSDDEAPAAPRDRRRLGDFVGDDASEGSGGLGPEAAQVEAAEYSVKLEIAEAPRALRAGGARTGERGDPRSCDPTREGWVRVLGASSVRTVRVGTSSGPRHLA